MKYIVTMNGRKYEVEVERMSPFHQLTREEIASGVSTEVKPVSAPAPKAAPAPAPRAAAPAPKAAPAPAPKAAPAPAPKAAAPAAGSQNITSPMPGSILGIKVNVGDKVTAGQTVILLEAMKMENEIVAPVDGTIASINVKTGDTVDTDQVLATLK